MSKDKSDFLKVYASLPVGLRSEIVVVDEEVGPITWNVAYFEITNETDLGSRILKKLEALEII